MDIFHIIITVLLVCYTILLLIQMILIKRASKTIMDLRKELTLSNIRKDIYESAFKSVADQLNEECPSFNCEDCVEYFHNPIGGHASCKYYSELPEEGCEHFHQM